MIIASMNKTISNGNWLVLEVAREDQRIPYRAPELFSIEISTTAGGDVGVSETDGTGILS